SWSACLMVTSWPSSFAGTSLVMRSVSLKERPSTRPTSLITLRALSFPSAAIWATRSRPYFSTTYWMTSSRRFMQKSTSKSGMVVDRGGELGEALVEAPGRLALEEALERVSFGHRELGEIELAEIELDVAVAADAERVLEGAPESQAREDPMHLVRRADVERV